jgi:hypothetical protein
LHMKSIPIRGVVMPVPEEVIGWLDEEENTAAQDGILIYRIWERLRQQNMDEVKTAEVMRSLAPLEFLAHGKKPEIWGSVFSPRREADLLNGVDEYPNLVELNGTHIDDWMELATTLKRPYLRARFADAVWELSEKIANRRKLYRYGLLAAEMYLEAAGEAKDRAFYECLQATVRSIQLAFQLRSEELSARGFELIMEFADTAEPSHIGRWFAPFDRLIHQRGLTDLQRERIIDSLEKRFWDTIDREDIHHEKMAGQALALYYQAHKDFDKAKRITLAYGESIVKLTASLSAMLAVHHLSEVMNDYLRMGMRDDADRVRLALEERGKGAAAEMYEHKVEIKLELDDIEKSIAEKLDHPDPFFALYRLAISCAPHPEETIERFKAASEGLIFHQLMPVSIIGDGGLPVANIGTYDNDPEGRHVMEYTREMQLNANFLMHGIEQWKKKFDRPDFHEVPGLFDCLLIPEVRRPLFEEGFAAYAAGDYVKAIHVLIPQVENSLRELLKLLDLPTTKNDDEGGFELKNMNHVLHDEVVQASLDERLWRFLKVLYTDKRGFNLRNIVMHGIAEPKDFNQANAALVLQSVMLLTMVRENGVFMDSSGADSAAEAEEDAPAP